jgi:hypothetical protein
MKPKINYGIRGIGYIYVYFDVSCLQVVLHKHIIEKDDIQQ